MFLCEKCGKNITTAKKRRDHYNNHDEKEIQCYICDIVCMGKLSLRNHMRKHKVKKTSTKTEKKEYSCPKCTFFTYKKSNLTRHEQNCGKVKEKKNICVMCVLKCS